MNRLIVNIVILLSVFFFPWWAACFFALIAVFLFDYPEVVLVGALLDGSYGMYGLFPAQFTIVAFLIFIIALYLKPRLSLYNPI